MPTWVNKTSASEMKKKIRARSYATALSAQRAVYAMPKDRLGKTRKDLLTEIERAYKGVISASIVPIPGKTQGHKRVSVKKMQTSELWVVTFHNFVTSDPKGTNKMVDFLKAAQDNEMTLPELVSALESV